MKTGKAIQRGKDTYYNPTKGTFDDISILEVLQIFGRAVRPQYDIKGEAILMTSADKIDKYLKIIKRSEDIESKMLYSFPEALNSEIYLTPTCHLCKHLLFEVRLIASEKRYSARKSESCDCPVLES